MPQTLTNPAAGPVADRKPDAAAAATSAASTKATPATPPVPVGSPFTTGPVRLGVIEQLMTGASERPPWFRLNLAPAVEDCPGFLRAMDAALAEATAEAEQIKAAFLAGPEMAAVRAAEARLKENADAVAKAEADLKASTAEWRQAVGYAKLGGGADRSKLVKEQEALVRDRTAELDRLKKELPDALRAAVQEQRAAAQAKLRSLLATRAQEREAADEANLEAAKGRFAAVVAEAFTAWQVANKRWAGAVGVRYGVDKLARLP